MNVEEEEDEGMKREREVDDMESTLAFIPRHHDSLSHRSMLRIPRLLGFSRSARLYHYPVR
jgi:hypothetical protein